MLSRPESSRWSRRQAASKPDSSTRKPHKAAETPYVAFWRVRGQSGGNRGHNFMGRPSRRRRRATLDRPAKPDARPTADAR